MKVTVTSEQKWVLGALGVALLAAVPSFFMGGAGSAPASPSAGDPGRPVEARGDAVPIQSSDWTPQVLSGDEQQTLKEVLKLDINHATAQELIDAHLPGVGEGTAKNIIKTRDALGCFRTIEDIQSVKGFGGASKFDAVKDLVRIDITNCTFREPGESGDDPAPAKKSSKPRGPGASSTDGPININRASVKELDALPSIGKTTAERIVEYRTEHGDFATIEEIMQVKGIRQGTFDKIKDLITVDE